MKIAMMSYTMARGEWGQSADVEALCRLTRELGLEGIDWVTTYGQAPADVRRITDDFGLRNVCYTFFARLQSPDPEERKAALDQVKEGLEVAAALGADKVMLPLSGSPDLPREETRRCALESLPAAVAMGNTLGIAVTIEHFPGAASPFLISADMDEAIRAVPGLKITYDNGNLFTGGENPADGYRNSAEHIIHAHFKDFELADDGFLGLDGRRYRGALVGEGLVDPWPCLQAMRERGYSGAIDFEYEGTKYTPEEAMRKAVPMLQAMIERLG
jgi:sugar phosphate isomerase/epimerase